MYLTMVSFRLLAKENALEYSVLCVYCSRSAIFLCCYLLMLSLFARSSLALLTDECDLPAADSRFSCKWFDTPEILAVVVPAWWPPSSPLGPSSGESDPNESALPKPAVAPYSRESLTGATKDYSFLSSTSSTAERRGAEPAPLAPSCKAEPINSSSAGSL